MNRRRLYRCRHDQRLAGVASGVAEYFDLDPTLVRVVWLVSIFFGGFTLLLYIAMAIIVPLEPESFPEPGPWQPGSDLWGTTAGSPAAGDPGTDPTQPATAGEPGNPAAGIPASGTWAAPHRHQTRGSGGLGAVFFGAILILFGSLALIDTYLPDWADHGRFLWPAFILGIGVLLVISSIRRRPNAL